MPKLIDWVKLGNGSLYGQCFHDEKGRFEDGEWIVTSRVKELDLENNKATTLNTVYDLGEQAEAGEDYDSTVLAVEGDILFKNYLASLSLADDDEEVA